MRPQALFHKLTLLGLMVALSTGCVAQKGSFESEKTPLEAKLADSPDPLVDQASMAYLSGIASRWVNFQFKPREAVTANPQPPMTTAPVKLKEVALATTLQNELEVDPQIASKLAPLIEKSAAKHDVPPYLIAAVVNEETEFDSKKRSSAGAIGLAQIMPNVWGKECGGNLRQDAANIDCSAKILAHYHELTGDWEQALAFYNVGPGKYEKSRKARSIGHKYASSVMYSMGKIKQGRELILASIQSQR